MIENFEKIKQYVLTLGEFEDTPKLNLQIEMLINQALAYCYRDDVPSMMELPLADVIVNQLKTNETLGFDSNNITSYSEGDMSVSFGNSSNSSSSDGSGKYYGKLEPFKQIIGIIEADV